jgi:hypothetical protein
MKFFKKIKGFASLQASALKDYMHSLTFFFVKKKVRRAPIKKETFNPNFLHLLKYLIRYFLIY